jgi:hypothetical protein
MRRLTDLSIACLALTLLIGCGSEDPDETAEPDADNGPVADTGGLDASADDVTDSSSQDTTSRDASEPDTGDDTRAPSNLFVNFEYRKVEEGGLSTRTGVEVTLLGNTRITKHTSNSRSEDLTDEDALELQQDYLTDEVYEKMEEDSWECGSEEKYNGARHEFEAQLGTQAGAPEPIRTISGCIAGDSSQPDAELVQRLVGKLQNLRDSYFN